MSDEWSYKSSKLMDFGQEKVSVLFARTTEMMERAAALGERVLEDILELDDEELIYIFTNEPLWLERLEHLNAARYRTGSDLSYIKDELCPDEIFEVKTSMSIAKLVDKKVHHMLRKVKTEMKARSLSLVPGYGEAFISECLDKPQYVGGIAPNIFMFIQEIEKFFTAVRIPLALQGSYIRKNCLSGKALDAVNLCLPVGSQVKKKDIFEILLRKFGNSLYLKRVLMKEHRNIGKIFTHGGELSTLEWGTVNKSCLQHIQLINSFESVLETLGESVLCSEYLITLKQLLPTEVIFRTVLDTENNLKSTFDIIKEEIIKIEHISSQCLIEHEILEITKNPKVVDNFRIEVSGTEKHHGEVSKLCVCRVCKLLLPGSDLKPTHHRITKTGFPMKDLCPHISSMSQSQKSTLLVRNKVCRACLSVRADTAGHGPEGSCKYLSKKKLLHLKCKMPGCEIRQSFCTSHNYQDHPSVNEESRQESDQVMGTDRDDSYNGSSPERKGTNTVAEESINNVERETPQMDFNKFDCFNHMNLSTVSNQDMTSLNEDGSYETSMNELEFKMGSVGHEMIELVKGENEKAINEDEYYESFEKKRVLVKLKVDRRAINSNIIISDKTLVRASHEKNSTLRVGEKRALNLWTSIFKLIAFKSLDALLDTGQSLF